MSGRTLKYLLKSRGYVATGAELLQEIDQAVARNNFGADVELREQLEMFSSARGLKIFHDKECLDLFFSGKFSLDYGKASLAFFTKERTAERAFVWSLPW